MKKSHVILLLVALVILVIIGIAIYWSHHSVLSGMWVGTHQILSSTDGPDSFNSKECKTFCNLKVSSGQVTGAITMFGLDSHAFRDTEELHGTIHAHIIEWTSSRSWDDANQKHHQYTATFHGTQSGNTISGHFEQTWSDQAKPVTYGGSVELKKQPNTALEPTATAP